MAKSLGVYLTYILRHCPQEIGIAMNTQGWVSVADLLAKASYKKKPITLEDLQQEVARDEKQRFQFSVSGDKVRCVQGHSVEHVLLDMKPYVAHDKLYHGTARKNIASIQETGLGRRRRKHVHLTTDPEAARRVGQRHGDPVVFSVDTKAMITHGFRFYQAANGVILIEEVPPRYLVLL